MLPRTSRAAALMLLGVLALSSCELTVRIATDVEADGSGRFALDVHLDQELLRGLQQAAAEGSDLSSLEALFARLEQVGWQTSRTQPAGGLLLEASRPFTDETDLERALTELASAGGREASPLDLGGLGFDHRIDRSLLRTRGSFSGSIDLSFGDDVDPLIRQLEDVLADTVHFEIRAGLPGEMTVTEGDGTIEDGAVVWRPEIGRRTSFAAESTQLRAGPLLSIVIPALVLLALLAWFLTGRRSPSAMDAAAATAPHEAIVLDGEPAS